MYQIIEQIISHSWETQNSAQQYIYYTCCALILVFSAVFLDMVVRILFRFSAIK